MPMRKVALVTGAGSGIGKASALTLMRIGLSVVLNGRRKKPLEAAAVEGRAFGAEAIAVAGDVTDPAFVKALFGKAKAAFGLIDVLFNNAGVFTIRANLGLALLDSAVFAAVRAGGA